MIEMTRPEKPEACNFGAITIVNGRAYINQELCKECGSCKKACPYDAISEVMRPCKRSCPTGALDINPNDRRAMIKEELCVNCGSCMRACPFGAISDKSLIVPVAKRLARKRKMYAVVAPAITGQFGPTMNYGKIRNAIRTLGFEEMIVSNSSDDFSFDENTGILSGFINSTREFRITLRFKYNLAYGIIIRPRLSHDLI